MRAVVRRVAADDRPAVVALLAATGGSAWADDVVPHAVGAGARARDDRAAPREDRDQVWLAAVVERSTAERAASPLEGAEAVVGVVGVRFAPDGVAEVLHVAVDRALRQRGIGTALLDAAVARAHDQRARALELEVRVDNEAARGLYGEAGFAAVRTRAGYYRDGVDALVLSLSLGGA